MSQVGIETDSIEFRIEGLSRPVVRNLSLRISGVNLVAESIEFGSFFDGYGADKPLKVTIHGLWAGVNAQVPEGILSVNNAILALPEKSSFQAPLPIEINFKDGVILYENHERKIQGEVNGQLLVEGTQIDWEMDIDVAKQPVEGRGHFNWATGRTDVSGEMDLSHTLSLAIWDILNEDPFFDWNEGRLQTAFHFEGEDFHYQNGQAHFVFSDLGISFDSLELRHVNQVASMIWTPGHTTVDFTGDGEISRLLEAPFDWLGTLSLEPGPNLQFKLSQASIAPEWDFGTISLAKGTDQEIPLEISVLAADEGFDFQVMGLDLQVGTELGEQLGGATLDLMFNGHLRDHILKSTTADIWLRDGMFIAPMFQAGVGESLLNLSLDDVALSQKFFTDLVSKPRAFLTSAEVSDVTLYLYTDVVGENIVARWDPENDTPLEGKGDFAGIGEATFSVDPKPGSTMFKSSGVLALNPGDFFLDYKWDFDPAAGLDAELKLTDYAIQNYPNLREWMTGEFDITGFLSAQLDVELTLDKVQQELSFQLSEVLYAGGNLVLDNLSYGGVIDSIEPFQLKTVEPFKVSSVQINGWTVSDFQTEFEIGNRINLSNSKFKALGGSVEIANVSMDPHEMFIDSEIGVHNLQTEEILPWIPKVIGVAEGSISGVIPFQWDINNKQFSLGRGHLHSPEGELGYMNLKIFRPEGDEPADPLADSRYSMVDEALSNLQDSSLDIDIIPPNSEAATTRVRLNIKGFVDSRLVKAPVDVVRYYDLPLDALNMTMEQMRQDLPGFRPIVD
ncbi:MAG: YdbH domain-containing protein [Verrucomicrobiae bacterium]|nr:YdbH domain-containing protein [Verrucomicrobiae bacterium]